MTKTELWANPKWRSAHWGARRGRVWSDKEYDRACMMRLFCKSDAEIAAALGRTEKSVVGKIGYWRRAV